MNLVIGKLHKLVPIDLLRKHVRRKTGHVPLNAVSNILTDIRYHHILSVYPREQGKFCKINFHTSNV